MNSDTLNKKIAIVTGVSHSNGIGAAIARKLASEGIDIFFTYWEAEAKWVKEFQEELRRLEVECESGEFDLSISEAAGEILNEATEKLGFPTILINNAAHSARDGYELLDAKVLDDHYAVNMRATFLLSVEFARRFKKLDKSSGRIINLTSGQALGPMIGELAYVATKGAITAFTLSLSAELAPLGITVNAVNPGPTDSGWMTEAIKDVLKPKFLMGRIGMPEDGANLVAFIASDEARWITGQVINSEGGFLRN
jgi:3-oxoacyl-[acyl-carrier protein] reductase